MCMKLSRVELCTFVGITTAGLATCRVREAGRCGRVDGGARCCLVRCVASGFYAPGVLPVSCHAKPNAHRRNWPNVRLGEASPGE